MIEIKALTKTYGKFTALDHIDLTISQGMFGLLGANGAGKTTLMRLLAGILFPTSGGISIFGHDLATTTGRMATKTLLGYLPQDTSFNINLSARELLHYVATLKAISPQQRKQQVDRALDIVRLTHEADRRVNTFSGGMKRRIGIAQALLGEPKLLIVDEPTTGLDPEERLRIRNTLAEVARQSIVLLSTHIIEDISQSCRALAVIAKGKILFQGPPRQLALQAQNQVWVVESNDDNYMPPSASLISIMQYSNDTHYRIFGKPTDAPRAREAEPTLEDGYLWLMKNSSTTTEVKARDSLKKI